MLNMRKLKQPESRIRNAVKIIVRSHQDITITRDKAYDMVMIVKKRYAGDTLINYPDILKYHPHCQGAILSLVYNRSISLKGDLCKEMKKFKMISNKMEVMQQLL